MTRKQLPFFAGFIVLLFGAMACACLGSGVGIGGAQATVNAALTQAAAGAATAGSVGGAVAGTAEAQATSAAATAGAAGNATVVPTASGGTTGEATATPASSGGQPTAVTTAGGGGGAAGGPSDIPVVKGDNTILLVSQQLVSYLTKTSFADTVKFYQGNMPENGWTADASTTVVTANADVLGYTKDTRKAQVAITADPNSGQTAVVITIH